MYSTVSMKMILSKYSAPRCDKLGQKCKWCPTAKGSYIDLNPSQRSFVTNNPMDLLFIDFMKVGLN